MQKISLTPEQTAALTPLWEYAQTLPHGWAMIAQVHPTEGWMSVKVLPKEYADETDKVLLNLLADEWAEAADSSDSCTSADSGASPE